MGNRIFLTTLLLLLSCSPMAEPPNQLEAITLSPTEPLTILLQLSRPPQISNHFSLEGGEKFIIDLTHTINQTETPSGPLPAPLRQLRTAHNGQNLRLLVEFDSPQTVIATTADETLSIQLQPSNTNQEGAKQDHQVSLSLHDVTVQEAIRTIAEQAQQNIIIHGNISETTSLHLHQIHWKSALQRLAQQHQLQLEEKEWLITLTAPPQPPTTEGVPQRESSTIAPPMKTEIIPLHYANATNLKKTLESDQKNPLLSENGRLGVDERTNALLVQESETRLHDIRTLIAQLDTPAKQVLIESRIVIAADDFTHELGSRLGVTHLRSAQNQWGFSLSGSSEAANSALQGTTPGVSGSGNRLAVNLPVTSAGGRIGLTLAKLASGSLIDLELSAAQIEGKTEIIASPRIITANGYEATIQQGVQIPYRSDTLSGGTDVSFKDAVMELRVTPQITPDHRIILSLQVKKDAVGAILCNNCEPSVDTREVKTRVMIEDGETLVIGGIYEQRKSESENRVPLLADLPLIGPLFRNHASTNGKDELLIFITPSILQSQAQPGRLDRQPTGTDNREQNHTEHLSGWADGRRKIDHRQTAGRIAGQGVHR